MFRVTDGSQYVMDTETIESILSQKGKYKYIRVNGNHNFTGMRKKKFDKLKEQLDEFDVFMKHVQEVYELYGLTLEYGGGLPVPYFEGEDFDRLYQPLEMLMTVIFAYTEVSKLRVLGEGQEAYKLNLPIRMLSVSWFER